MSQPCSQGMVHSFSTTVVTNYVIYLQVCSLLSRLRFVEGAGEFTEHAPDPNNCPAIVVAIHAEATALLQKLEEEASSEAAHASRFIQVGADEGTCTGGTSGSFGGGSLGGIDEAQVPPNASPDYPQTTAQRIEHGTQAQMHAFQACFHDPEFSR